MTTNSSEIKKARLPRLQPMVMSLENGKPPPEMKSKTIPGIRLTPRDLEIIETIYLYRVLTTPQIEALLFPGPEKKERGGEEKAGKGSGKINSRCQYRLQLLFHHGYLLRDEIPSKLSEGRKPFLYTVAPKGLELLAECEGYEVEELMGRTISLDASYLFLEHLLKTNTVRLSIQRAARKHNWTIRTWLDDKALKSPGMKDTVTLIGPQGGKRQAAVVPDGYFVLENPDRVYHHFLEIDMGTVTGAASVWGRRDFAHKVQAYLEYHQSGKYEARYKTTGLRILTVTTSEKRANYLCRICEGAGGKGRFWFTTFDKVTPEAVLTEPIWSVAGAKEKRALTTRAVQL